MNNSFPQNEPHCNFVQERDRRNGSPRAEDICVERTDVGCRADCHRRACSQWVCMDIEVGRVLEAVGERLRLAAKFSGVAEVGAGGA